MSMKWLIPLLIGLVPISLFVSALLSDRVARWNLASLSSLYGVIIALIAGFASYGGYLSLEAPERWVLSSNASLVILGLVSFIGFINIGYSRRYMSGDAQEEKNYLKWLLITLGSVATVVIANHMLVFIAAWVAISLSLHKLLIFFPDRQRAVLAAHKKFIFARVAETFLFGAILILHYQHGTWFISDIRNQWLSSSLPLSGADQLAAILLAGAALIKCAQLPLHGWLIQVVEAPTPVSALLHAGIINLGGYLMIIFAPLIMASDAAQSLLLIVGGLTTVVAALIMMTRASVKVRLAWSTMSQMGLMLVECGLGLFELALLHLVAHSFYKAYSFLNSGTEVDAGLKKRLANTYSPTFFDWTLGAIVSFSMVYGLIYYAEIPAPYSPWLLFGIAMTLLIAEGKGRIALKTWGQFSVLAAVLLVAYSLQKAGFEFIAPSMEASLGWKGDAWIGMLIMVFAILYLAIRYQASRPMINKFRRALYAGFYLDEWVTKVSLRLYPARLPERQSKKLDIPTEEFVQ